MLLWPSAEKKGGHTWRCFFLIAYFLIPSNIYWCCLCSLFSLFTWMDIVLPLSCVEGGHAYGVIIMVLILNKDLQQL